MHHQGSREIYLYFECYTEAKIEKFHSLGELHSGSSYWDTWYDDIFLVLSSIKEYFLVSFLLTDHGQTSEFFWASVNSVDKFKSFFGLWVLGFWIPLEVLYQTLFSPLYLLAVSKLLYLSNLAKIEIFNTTYKTKTRYIHKYDIQYHLLIGFCLIDHHRVSLVVFEFLLELLGWQCNLMKFKLSPGKIKTLQFLKPTGFLLFPTSKLDYVGCSLASGFEGRPF